MNGNLLVSVVMPVYNASRFLDEAVNSVLSQSFTDFELILIDDSSTDDSFDKILEYQRRDLRVRAFQNSENKGVSFTRNFGVAKANGEYIALIDSDDMWDKDKLKSQVELINQKTDADICYTGSAFVDTDSKLSDFVFEVPLCVDYKTLLKQNVISCSSALVRKSVLTKYPMMYDNMHEDYATWLSALKDGCKAYGINKPLLIYRVNKDSKSGNKLHSLMMAYRVYRYMGINPFLRVYYMLVYTVNGIKKYKDI